MNITFNRSCEFMKNSSKQTIIIRSSHVKLFLNLTSYPHLNLDIPTPLNGGLQALNNNPPSEAAKR